VFYDGPGLGKTTLAANIAADQDAHFHELAADKILATGAITTVRGNQAGRAAGHGGWCTPERASQQDRQG
jgi:hypothetical protein